MTPICSVVIPVYNRENYIAQTLESVRKQSFSDIEIILIDDCSTDGSYDLMRELSKADHRISVYKNEKNLGVADTRNKGVALARGKYIALLDSDDIWLYDKLEKQMNHLKEKDCRLSYCSYGFIDKNGNDIGGVFKVPSSIDLGGLLKRNVISCSTVLAERELFEKYPFNKTYYHEDLVEWINMLKECKVSYGYTKELAKIRIMKGSKSGDKLNAAKQRWLIYRNHMDMNLVVSSFYFLNYALFSAIKYRSIRKDLK
ncbi:MAG TPA: glycosyl transferase [Eubacteriaceae bacterium]|jgi:teichuronic acid biosynthesis glycosyltransferase TuaG|nr:glycosyl transferase [Eubacteriaceae bacterium]